MTAEAADREIASPRRSAASRTESAWFAGGRSAVVRHAVINLFMIIILLPLAWVLMMSVKSFPDAMRGDFWPQKFDFGHYGYVFQEIRTLPINLFNSLYVTIGAVVVTTVCAVMAGYALVHLPIRGGAFIVVALVTSLYIPVRVVSLVSVYEMQNSLGLINHTGGLILPYVTINLAISVLIMRAMFKLVPRALMEAAEIDGAGPWRRLWSIGLPLTRNGVAVVLIVNFVTVWGEFLMCATLINDQSGRTMPVVLAAAQGGVGQWAWPNLAAVYVIVVVPGIVAFALAQKVFYRGLMEGMTSL